MEVHADVDEARAAKAAAERDRVESVELRDARERLEGARRAKMRDGRARDVRDGGNLDGLLGKRKCQPPPPQPGRSPAR